MIENADKRAPEVNMVEAYNVTNSPSFRNPGRDISLGVKLRF